MSQLDLYHPIILKYNKEPFRFLRQQNTMHVLEAYNPVCGDQFKFYFDLVNAEIQNLSFHGYGCAVSKASSSILVEHLQDVSIQIARDILSEFLEHVAAPGEVRWNLLGQECEAFRLGEKYPARMQCVNLGWHSMQEFLHGFD